MDRYYSGRNRSRSPPPRNRTNSSATRLDLPEFIPLVSSSTQQHSDSDRRSRNSRDRRSSPPPRRSSRERSSTKSQRRRISPPPPVEKPLSPHSKRSRRNDNRRRSHSRSPQHSPKRSSNTQHDRSRTTSSERANRSVFNRLGVQSQRNHSPINFNQDYRRNSPIANYPAESRQFRDEIDFEPVRIVVRNDNYQGSVSDGFNSNRHVTANDVQAEIIYSIRHLEQKNRDNLRHIQGVRMTIENYQREIYKLEQIVGATTEEIEKLKARLSLML